MMTLSPLTNHLISALDRQQTFTEGESITVNQVVSEVASWYEKLRNAMEYKEEEVMLRAAIERILKRRLILGGGKGKDLAYPLVRELIWARYFPDQSIPETLVEKVAQTIDLYLDLQNRLIGQNDLPRNTIYEWMIQLLSSEVENILSPRGEKELLSNYIFQIMRSKVTVIDDSEETRDIQVFIAVRRAFAKEDLALLRYHLFLQYFGEINSSKVEKIALRFRQGWESINYQLNYSLKEKIYGYVKNRIAPFLILEELFKIHRGHIREVVSSDDRVKVDVLSICADKYRSILIKVQRAVIRSVIFIFITKAILALAVEASFENLLYGAVNWIAISANTLISPLIMIFIGLSIKTPDKENSNKILEQIQSILSDDSPNIGKSLTISLSGKKMNPLLQALFGLLWLLALFLGIYAIHYVLHLLQFNVVSQGVFVFFMMIVSFLAYRISETARIYTVKQEKQGVSAVLFDFFFVPFITIGRNLTKSVSRINIFLFIFDYIIETPFKEIFAFFEQWFLYLHNQREGI